MRHIHMSLYWVLRDTRVGRVLISYEIYKNGGSEDCLPELYTICELFTHDHF